jgi:abequosyltransferase
MLLSICIPTYNRAECLRKCLSGLLPQIDNELVDIIEVIVSDNASTDNTQEIVLDYSSYKNFAYHKNQTNLGMDGNFYACYKYAKGKFIWVFSDDDFLLPNALHLIVNFLQANRNIGVCYLSSEWAEDIETANISVIRKLDEEFCSSQEFIEKVNYWVTFLTGNIINKDLVKGKIFPEENMGTLFVQLSWVIPAIFFSNTNVIIKEKVILCKSNNTGGYKLFEVFGANLNAVLDRMVHRKIIDLPIKHSINNKLIQNFFPPFLKAERSSFKNEQVFLTLLKVFWSYSSFWKTLFPIFIKRAVK